MEKELSVKEYIAKRNLLIEKNGVKGILIVTAGAKRKRFTVYKYGVYKDRNGIVKKSIYNKEFLGYISELPDIKEVARKHNGCLIELRVDVLSKFKTSDVPKWKFLTFGKYIKTNVDEIPNIDKNYAFWLIKNSTENRIRGRFYTDLDVYILSDEFLMLVKKANKRNDWYINLSNEDVKNRSLAEKLISKSIPFTKYPNKIEFFIMKNGEKIIIGATFDMNYVARFASEQYPSCILNGIKPERITIRVCLQSSIVK